MALDSKLRQQLDRLLTTVVEDNKRGQRLADDARRIWYRCRRFLQMNLVPPGIDSDALELASYAIQLPNRLGKGVPMGRMGQVNLRDRAEQAAELIISSLGENVDESLLDRTTRLLHELPGRAPALNEAKLLADAVNLDDFGVIGLLLQTIQIGLQGGGVQQVAEGGEKRQQYGYWEARLKDGFHFEPIRQIARKRLEHAARGFQMLLVELQEDQPA